MENHGIFHEYISTCLLFWVNIANINEKHFWNCVLNIEMKTDESLFPLACYKKKRKCYQLSVDLSVHIFREKYVDVKSISLGVPIP